jgi:hypothetical protein
MANGLASARKQLQWRLIYAAKRSLIDFSVFADRRYLFSRRSVPSFRTKITKAYAATATNAQSVGVY